MFKGFHTKKISFYIINYFKYLLVPKIFFRVRLQHKLNSIKRYNSDEIYKRVDNYIKINKRFSLEQPETLKNFKIKNPINIDGFYRKKQISAPFFDFIEYLYYFDKNSTFRFISFDAPLIQSQPTIVKSRPINKHNDNAIIFNLDKTRLFRTVRDDIKFEDKLDHAVFRGTCYQPHRQKFIEKYYNLPKTNFGDTRKSEVGTPYHKDFMSIKEQLKYKYIVSIEGNDVASNLKWIMASNSLCFMIKPKYASWFAEELLIPNYHYVLLKEDYSDIQEKMEYYNNNPQEALKIIKNANEYVNQFKDKKREDLISLLVLKKYFDLQN